MRTTGYWLTGVGCVLLLFLCLSMQNIATQAAYVAIPQDSRAIEATYTYEEMGALVRSVIRAMERPLAMLIPPSVMILIGVVLIDRGWKRQHAGSPNNRLLGTPKARRLAPGAREA